MPRETFILEQDIADGQIRDSHVKPGTILHALITRTTITLRPVFGVLIPDGATSIRLDETFENETVTSGPGVEGILVGPSENHNVFLANSDDAVIGPSGKEVVGRLTFTPMSDPYSVSAVFGSNTVTYVGDPTQTAAGDSFKITDGVTTFLQAQVITNTPTSGTSGILQLSLPFPAATGPYVGRRKARWKLDFFDFGTGSPFTPSSALTVDLGIRKRVLLAFTPEGYLGGGQGGPGAGVPPAGLLPETAGAGVVSATIELLLDPGESFIWFHGLDTDIPLLTWWVEWPGYPVCRFFYGLQGTPSGPFFSHVECVPTMEATAPVDIRHLDENSASITNRNTVQHRVKAIMMRSL